MSRTSDRIPAPALAGALALALAAPASGQTCPLEAEKLLADDGGVAHFFGFDVGISGSTAVVGAVKSASQPTEPGAAYLFDVTTGQQLAKLAPTDSAIGDLFGWSVAIDGSTVVVGAALGDAGGFSNGSAYTFDAQSGQQLAELLPAAFGPAIGFGRAVDVCGNTAIVGAFEGDFGANDTGGAWLFDATTGQELFQLVPDDTGASQFLGDSVAIGGTTAIVGAPGGGAAGVVSGAAYLFDTATGQQTAKLVPSNGFAAQGFGTSVAIDGAVVVVGGPHLIGGFGTAYVFDATTGQELFQLVQSDAAPDDQFGASVAVSGSIVVVGAPADDDLGGSSGSVYVYDAATGDELAKLLSSDGQFDDVFGEAVAIHGTIAVIGAGGDDEAGFSTGAAYVFRIPAPPTVFCTAKTNSLGCVPAIDSAGVAGFSEPDPFPITAREVLNQRPGLFFYGISGRASLPFLGGTLCALPPLQRTPILGSGGRPTGDDCSGAYLFDFNAWIASGSDPDLVPGIRVDGQFWSRDPNHPDGTGVGLTDAIEFDLCP